MKIKFTPGSKRLLFFDWNQTLVDTHNSFDRAFIEVLQEYTGRWAGQDGLDPREALSKYKREWNQRRSNKRSFDLVSAKSLERALAPYPLEVDQQFADKFLQEIKRKKTRYYRLLPGTRATLEKLSANYQLAIISNGGGINLKQSGLDDLIQQKYCFTSAEVGSRKPSKSIFMHALTRVNKKPKECVMIGNSWTRDINGATRAGLDSVWIRSHAAPKPFRRIVNGRKVIIIRSITQLLDIF